MQIDLEGLRALVTGSTAGIGAAIAERLAQNGAEVIINGRTAERVAKAIASLQAKAPGARFHAAPGDVATAKGIDDIIAAAGAVDILVNNAGWFEPKDAFEISDGDWHKAFDTNVMSGIRLTRALAPRMRDKGFGRIVFISSESGVQIPTEMIHYGLSKTAQLAAVRGFAQALQKTGVTVNAVLPGPTRSEGVGAFLDTLARDQGTTVEEIERGFFEHARPTSVLKRFIEPGEIADVVAFVCSREASAITGAPIRADGGVVQSIA
ncbi:MAG TPA: SDR family NAD(P)-dependent oxidoreductase [Steroidobacteraceae bacterium]|nr:SDR family NAD(P)-dependent oxidoreductase [Steroidobacteraceae bacterium]